jgi:hypothetical protein
LKKRTPKVAKDIFDRPNKGPQYTFDSNDQIFQTKLEKLLQKENLKILTSLQKATGPFSSVYCLSSLLLVCGFL